MRRAFDGETAATACEAWQQLFSTEQFNSSSGGEEAHLKERPARLRDEVSSHLQIFSDTSLMPAREGKMMRSSANLGLRTLMKGSDKMMVCSKPVPFSKLFIQLFCPPGDFFFLFHHIRNLKESATAAVRLKV